ncbi:hypothetical protein FB451DRAFT_1363557 [Mycena latifolia]|nr:hypothetical protein FB451DRAFT_1363557 [Mycena latifolia]
METVVPPCFPPELEREIFETAALQNVAMTSTLLVVARRVFAWVEPLLYRTIALDRSARSLGLKVALDSKRASVPHFLRDNVRQLYFDSIEDDRSLHDILSVCTGIQTLALVRYRDDPELLRDLEALGDLRRLTANLGDQGIFDAVESMDLRSPIFSNITHLDLFDDFTGIAELSYWTDLTLLPALTHLSLFAPHRTFIVEFLQGCKKLQALVYHTHFEFVTSTMKELSNKISIADPRFVLMVDNWNTSVSGWRVPGVNGGQDFWSRADLFISKRRRGDIEPVSRCWLKDCDGIA